MKKSYQNKKFYSPQDKGSSRKKYDTPFPHLQGKIKVKMSSSKLVDSEVGGIFRYSENDNSFIEEVTLLEGSIEDSVYKALISPTNPWSS